MAPKKGWKIFSYSRAWDLQLHSRKLVVRATLLKVQASCKLTCLPGFPSMQAEKMGKESLPFEETSPARKCQSTTSTTWWKERTWRMRVAIKIERTTKETQRVSRSNGLIKRHIWEYSWERYATGNERHRAKGDTEIQNCSQLVESEKSFTAR